MSRLPESLDPWRAADQHKRLEGVLSLGDLSRVVGLVVNPGGQVVYELEFFRDGQRRACVRGRVTATLLLSCQRCLEPVAVGVDARPLLAVVESNAEAERLGDEYDPVLVTEGHMAPLDLVEEEILLALPQVPTHAPDTCDPQAMVRLRESQAASREEHPFGPLAQLKGRIH